MSKAFFRGAIICIGSVLLQAAPMRATEWFISPGGSDSNPGTSEQAPFHSLSEADSMVAPGDTITVLDGT